MDKSTTCVWRAVNGLRDSDRFFGPQASITFSAWPLSTCHAYLEFTSPQMIHVSCSAPQPGSDRASAFEKVLASPQGNEIPGSSVAPHFLSSTHPPPLKQTPSSVNFTSHVFSRIFPTLSTLMPPPQPILSSQDCCISLQLVSWHLNRPQSILQSDTGFSNEILSCHHLLQMPLIFGSKTQILMMFNKTPVLCALSSNSR